MKRYWLYIFILVAVSAIVIAVQTTEKKPLDWRDTFSRRDKIPYGTYIIYDLLPEIFKGQKIETINRPLYEAMNSEFGGLKVDGEADTAIVQTDSVPSADSSSSLADSLNSVSYSPRNYIFINTAESLDSNACIRLLRRVYTNGSNVFMAQQDFPSYLKDTLHFHLSYNGDTAGLQVNFVNPALKSSAPYTYKRMSWYSVFSGRFDKENTNVLARNRKDSIVMIKVRFGKGAFFLSSTPYIFTNYHVLEGNNLDFAAKSLSYLPLADTYWYEYSTTSHEKVALSYILSQTPLRWAFYLLLFGIILYIIFEGKRKQRIVPIVPPVKNTSLEFAEIVGQLYYNHADHKNLADKMINHFYDFVRTHLFLKTNMLDDAFYKQLIQKTGIPQDEIRSLFTNFDIVNMHGQLTEDQLIELNKKLEDFYKKVQNK